MAQYKPYEYDGDTYLIPYGIWPMFIDKVESLSEDDRCDYLEKFERLEGKPFIIVLEDDLENYCNGA